MIYNVSTGTTPLLLVILGTFSACIFILVSFFFTFNCSVHFVSVNMSCLQRNVLIVTSKRVDESFGTFHFLQQVNQQLLLTILVILLGATASCW
jgi:hypothetical protein